MTLAKIDADLPPLYDATRADLAILEMVKRRKAQGILPLRWGVPYLDNTAHPLYPAWSYLICGRPGSMKSTFMSYLVTRWARALAQENAGRDLKRFILVVKPEESIEVARIQTWESNPHSLPDIVGGKPSPKDIGEVVGRQTDTPIVYMGDSESDMYTPKPKKDSPLVVKFSTRDIQRACMAIKNGLFHDGPCDIAVIAIDGLNLILDERRSNDQVEAMSRVPEELTGIARSFLCPLVATTQAIQKGVYNKADSIPHMDDVMWNSTASQYFWAFFGIERPVKRPGAEIWRDTINGGEGDKETYYDEDNRKYEVPVTTNLVSLLADKFRGTRNCESRKIALWAKNDGGFTQEHLPKYVVS